MFQCVCYRTQDSCAYVCLRCFEIARSSFSQAALSLSLSPLGIINLIMILTTDVARSGVLSGRFKLYNGALIPEFSAQHPNDTEFIITRRWRSGFRPVGKSPFEGHPICENDFCHRRPPRREASAPNIKRVNQEWNSIPLIAAVTRRRRSCNFSAR